jgi:hypothetical protein
MIPGFIKIACQALSGDAIAERKETRMQVGQAMSAIGRGLVASREQAIMVEPMELSESLVEVGSFSSPVDQGSNRTGVTTGTEIQGNVIVDVAELFGDSEALAELARTQLLDPAVDGPEAGLVILSFRVRC